MGHQHIVNRFFLGISHVAITFALLLGELAQLARALAWHARGRRFDPDILHKKVAYAATFFHSGN